MHAFPTYVTLEFGKKIVLYQILTLVNQHRHKTNISQRVKGVIPVIKDQVI